MDFKLQNDKTREFYKKDFSDKKEANIKSHDKSCKKSSCRG